MEEESNSREAETPMEMDIVADRDGWAVGIQERSRLELYLAAHHRVFTLLCWDSGQSLRQVDHVPVSLSEAR